MTWEFWCFIGVFTALIIFWIWWGVRIARDQKRLASEAAGDEEDPHLFAVAEAAWKTGKPIIGTVDEQGKLTMREIEVDHD